MIGDNEEAFVKRLFGNLVLAALAVAVLAFFAAPLASRRAAAVPSSSAGVASATAASSGVSSTAVMR